jgi:pimeloyl-ACP methyl ester carboxylesterase
MNVVGSDDDTGLAQQSTVNLQNLPNLVEVELAGAHHAAYLSQPVMFHTALHNFLLALRNVSAIH